MSGLAGTSVLKAERTYTNSICTYLLLSELGQRGELEALLHQTSVDLFFCLQTAIDPELWANSIVCIVLISVRCMRHTANLSISIPVAPQQFHAKNGFHWSQTWSHL